ncbi:actin binding protein [Heterostelium album PN500]|uniref:Actin binding protein n=1 Tax=Heterostelium pallidum (strain ATCC 26659 / Pp 5 / PN500) TaxID=670386 RepID=D3B5Q6_HETP5|nr:actin binding protein [Heterostelium album PN500]EFA83204.1 actin binding protein [Heterostelium album PN500]|eukprot:XP_020435321.1 actin binding protein [Heterostelium album PN500]
MDGITLIFNLLQSKKKETREECIRAIATFMNSTHGLKSVTSLPFAAKRLAMVLTSQQFTLKSRAIVIELLTVMCMEKWVPGGYSMVLKALTNLKEKKRFTNFVKFIKENSSLEMKTKALCFINVLIHEPEETSVRVNIRGEFLRLGLYDYLKPLKPTLSPDENLYLQIEIFEDMMMEDNQELDHKLEELKKKLGVDIENLDALFKALKSSASKSGLTKSLLSVMQNLLVLHSDSDGIKYWLLIDQLVRQISMQRNSLDGNDTIDMKSLLQNVDAQTKEVTLTRKMEELEKQNIDKAAIIQEKDMSIKQLLDLVKQIKLAGGDVSPALQKQIEEAIKNLDVPAAVVVVPTETIEITPPPPPPPISTNIPTTPEPAVDAPPPPPPPPMLGGGGGPPPPPPPPMGGKKNPAAIKTRPPPKVPKPAHPLKALQWTKMPPAKLNESVFDKLGEMNDIHLPWKTIEQEFAAKVIVRKEKPLRKLGPMQVIDAKLGQNISIFLSQFKTVPVRELIDAVQKQDEARLSKEQIRQMAKLLPSKDDMAALSDFLKVEDRSKLAAADQFCIDVGNFSFMGDKLALFQLRAEFQQRASELRPEIAAVSLACNELLKSNNLKRLFEIVLVLGNFINYGTVRGDQSGYKVDCMIKLADTKSADLQSNLIHTLVEYCEEKEPSLLAFADELPSLDVAKRVVWSGVVADLSMLSREFSLCKSIVDQFQKSNEPFCETMVPFLELAAIELDKLKKLQANTEESFKKLCIYLGEDSTKITPDEIFELFSRFATLFEAGLLLLQQIREQQEKDSKREQQKLLRAELKLKLAGKIQANNPQKKDDQDEDIVNDLLLAVRDGDVFRKGRRKVVLNRADSNHLSQLSPANLPVFILHLLYFVIKYVQLILSKNIIL